MTSKKCISLENFNPDDLVFEYVKEGKMSDGTSFKKTPISVRRSDETTGPLYVATDTCFSFGIQKDSKYGGYSIPLVLMDNKTPAQAFTLTCLKMRRYALWCNRQESGSKRVRRTV